MELVFETKSKLLGVLAGFVQLWSHNCAGPFVPCAMQYVSINQIIFGTAARSD